MKRSTPDSDTIYLNGIRRPCKPLKSKPKPGQKIATKGQLKRLSEWSGYDGARGCMIYIFDRPLSRQACNTFGLRFPAIEPGIYSPATAPLADAFHPDRAIAAKQIDRRAT